MNLDMSRPRNETNDLLLSLTKRCETPIKQTHMRNHNKQLNLSRPNQGKLSHLIHPLILVLTLNR